MEAAKNLIKSLGMECFFPSPSGTNLISFTVLLLVDLMTALKDEEGQYTEMAKPKLTYNPVLQRFYQSVERLFSVFPFLFIPVDWRQFALVFLDVLLMTRLQLPSWIAP
jgi:hypothetical protein